ncbi:hypothetical protein ABW20_dc0107198 [Dactylellina cionopaga]|nr:hypothetical protein ABW20_dc0107198 [Dactylellina cionopaga]
MSLSEKVFHLWKNRNEAARSDEFAGLAAATAAQRPSLSPSAPAFARQPEPIEMNQAQQSIGFRPLVPFQIPPTESENRSALPPPPPPAPTPATPNVSDGRRSIEILSPARNSDIIADRSRMEDASPHIPHATPHFQEPGQGDPNAHLPGVIYEANPLLLSEIWRATIYRLYAEQNEALTKYRRPNWLFHLDSHGIRTVGDLGGWRGDDESTRQLAANLITKLQETGYGTKGLQSRLKAITTIDVVEALQTLRQGGADKYRPSPYVGKRVTPIKWSAYTIGLNGLDDSPVQMQIRAEAGDTSMPDFPGLKRQVDGGNAAHPIRIKRKRTSSPGRESLTLVIPPDAEADAEANAKRHESAPRDHHSDVTTTPARPASTPARPASTPGLGDLAAQTGFTPINRSVSNPLMPPPQPPSSFEKSVEKRNSMTMIIGAGGETNRSPASTIDQPEEFEEDYDGVGDENLQFKLQHLSEGLEKLKREMKETKRVTGNPSSIVEKAAKEVFENFTRDFHEDYCLVRNAARENRQRIEKLESDTTTSSGGDAKQSSGGLTKRVDLLEEKVQTQFNKEGASRVEQLEGMMKKEFQDILSTATSGETLAARVKSFDIDMRQRVGRLEIQLDSMERDFRGRPSTAEAPASPIARRSSRSSAAVFGNPDPLRISRMEADMKLGMEKIEVKVEAVTTEVKEKIEKMESKIEAIDSDVKDIMNAVSALLKQAMTGGLAQSKPNGLRFGNSGK